MILAVLSPGVTIFLLGVFCILAGFGIIKMATSPPGSPSNTLNTIAWWAGVGILVLGLLLVLFPVVAYIYENVRQAFAV